VHGLRDDEPLLDHAGVGAVPNLAGRAERIECDEHEPVGRRERRDRRRDADQSGDLLEPGADVGETGSLSSCKGGPDVGRFEEAKQAGLARIESTFEARA